MKIMITGGAGFIGSHVAEALLSRGDQVLVLDNFRTGCRDNLPEHASLRLCEGHIGQTDWVYNMVEEFKPDFIVHAAASYHEGSNWQEDVRTNILGTANICKAAVKQGVKRLIYFQTALCYGLNPKTQPIPVETVFSPEGSSYAYSKTAGEQYIELSGIEYVTFRLANVYGPRNLSGPLANFYHRLTTGVPVIVTATKRDFVFVKDLVEIVLMALDGQGNKGAYHVSSGSDVFIKDLFDACVKAIGMHLQKDITVAPQPPNSAYTILLDPKKTLRDFPWKTRTFLEAGVEQAVAWYKKHGVRNTFSHLKLS